jgi:diadenosine tetraphosphatase ApaH/serine/threonine PP2A family protein phosphatase
MRLALISDIHSNLPALEATLVAIDAAGLETIWCLGDVVGYGADPDACAALVAERCELCLAGNHDLAVLGEIEVEAFSPSAAEGVKWTRDNCAPRTLEFLRGLEPADEGREVGLYHASPRDPIWEYVLELDDAAECLAIQRRRVSLIGHSHIALHFSTPETGDETPEPGYGTVLGAPAAAGTTIQLDGERRWLVNPGSVGQPRDGDPRAAWLELDTGAWTATFQRAEYDIDRAAAAIAAAGLPERLGERLYEGQ